jgi:hypothetical protein
MIHSESLFDIHSSWNAGAYKSQVVYKPTYFLAIQRDSLDLEPRHCSENSPPLIPLILLIDSLSAGYYHPHLRRLFPRLFPTPIHAYIIATSLYNPPPISLAIHSIPSSFSLSADYPRHSIFAILVKSRDLLYYVIT